MSDRQAVKEAMTELGDGAGGSIKVRAILWMVSALDNKFGDRLDAAEVIRSLEELASWCSVAKREIANRAFLLKSP